MLADNSGKMNKTFTNLETMSDSLKASDISAAVSNLKASLEKASNLWKPESGKRKRRSVSNK